MSDLADRIARLSAEKQALLARHLEKRRNLVPSRSGSGGSTAEVAATAPAVPAPERGIPRRSQGDRFPLSFAQERLWFLQRWAPESTFYNDFTGFRIRGALETTALLGALAAIQGRHEVLRVTFPESEDGRPQQCLHATAAPCVIVDLGSVPEQRREQALRRAAGLEARRAFDLRRDRSLRPTLVRLAPDDHALLLTWHHIATDEWSQGVFIRELATLYGAARRDERPRLTPLPIQYADFAAWQRDRLSEERLEKDLAFWRRTLADLPAALDLPVDRPHVAGLGPLGAQQSSTGPLGVSKDLESLRRRPGTTLFMVLLAAFKGLVARLSGQQDVVVGIPIAGRDQMATHGLIGIFLNLLVIRLRQHPEWTFEQLLDAVRQATIAAYAHQELPFEKLVEHLRQQGGLGDGWSDHGHQPLFQALFVLQNEAPASVPELPGLRMSPLGTAPVAAKYDWTLMLEPRGDSIVGRLKYDAHRVDGTTAQRFLRHFENWLNLLIERPDRPLAALDFLSKTEQHQLRREWNDTEVRWGSDRPLVPNITDWSEATPDALALVAGSHQISYGSLDRHVRNLAAVLANHQVGPEVLVGVLMERSAERVTALLAILRAGGAYVPLDPAYPEERLTHMIDDSRVALVVSDRARADLASRLAPGRFHVTVGTPPASSREPETVPSTKTHPAQVAYVIYTSGSTGRPKGVAVSHRAVVNRLLTMRSVYELGPGDRVLHKTPFSFDVSVWEIFWPLLSGACMVLAEPDAHRDPAALARTIAEQRVGSLHFVPSMLRAFLDHPASLDCTSLVRVFSGGEALPPDLPARFEHRLEARLENFYGPTETGIEATSWPVSGADRGPVPIGRPEANTRCLVVDRHQRPVALGCVGELVIGGIQLARGYLGRPAHSAERFVPDAFAPSGGGHRLYRTGDLVRQRSDGALQFLGRADHQVKVRGVRIELGEIESLLTSLPGVHDAAVLADGGSGGPQHLLAYAVGDSLDEDALLRALRAGLPKAMVPSACFVLDQLPRTPNGKLDRQALPKTLPQRSAASQAAAPRTPSEELVASVWREVLGVAAVAPTDSFFELGGHSLLAIQVATRLTRVFGMNVPVAEVFQAADMAALAQSLDQMVLEDRGGDRPAITADPDRKRAPLSFGQERLWVIQQMDPSNTAYNVPLVLDVEGPLAHRALAATLDTTEQRHALLRTVFPSAAGRPVQQTEPGVRCSLPLLDLSDLEPDQRQSETARWIAREIATPFDLVQGPVWRRLLVRRSHEDHTLILDFHHVVTDGWSTDVLMREIPEIYRAALEGDRPRLSELPFQYADYAAWQRAWLEGETLERELDVWRRSLEGSSPLDLPVDRPRRAVRSFRGAHKSRQLSAAATRTLEALASAQHATLFMVTLTAFQVFLARHCRQRDLVVGFPVAGRSHLELEALLGFFVNLLPLRVQLAPGETLRELLTHTRRATLEAHTRQDVPFGELMKALEMDGDPSRPPLVQAALSLEASRPAAGTLRGARVRPRAGEATTSKLEFTLFATRGEEGLELVAEYSTDLFDPTTIERLLRTFCHCLETLPQNLSRPWLEWSLLTDVHRHQVLAEWSGVERVHREALTVPQLLAERALSTPDALAVAGPAGALTFGQLQASARRLGTRLAARGVGRESIVALCLLPSPDLVVAAVAAWQAGAAYLPLAPEHPSSRLVETLDDSGARCVLTESALADRVEGSRADVWRMDAPEVSRHLIRGTAGEDPKVDPEAEDLAYVIYTSGSTGRPKGVGISHGGLANLVASQKQRYRLTPRDRATQVAGLGFDATVWEIWPPLAAGASLHLAPPSARLDPTALKRWLIDQHITLGFAATPLAEAMLSEPWRDASALRIFFTAGDRLRIACPPGLPFEFMNLYGPTENSVMATGDRVGDQVRGLPSIGRPIVGVRTLVVDPGNGHAVPPGVPGELLLGGHSLARGYLGRPALTASCFIPDPWGPDAGARFYRTGDLVRHRSDGRLDFLGRIDHQVKVRGVRVELGEVEARLRSIPQVREAVVVPHALRAGGTQLAAYVIPAPGATVNGLRESLRESLPETMVPAIFIPLESLPLTPNGKVDRRALPPPTSGLGSDGEGIAPRDEVELALATLWQEVLERPQILVHDDFFDLGGHSILAVRLMVSIEQRFGQKLPIATLFEARTVARLASVLRQQDAPVRREIVVPIRHRPTHASRRAPVIAVHPVGGHVLCYQELARRLAPERAFLGLQAPPVNPDAVPEEESRVELQATHYLEALADHLEADESPVLLGWSTGGFIAFEMAQQLREAGRPAPLVALLDSVPPASSEFTASEADLRRAFVRDLLGGDLPEALNLESLTSLPLRGAATRLVEHLSGVGAGPLGANVTDADRLVELYALFRWNLRAFLAYRPRPYSGRVEIFLTSGNSTGAGTAIWHPLAPSSLDLHRISGDHYSLLRTPHVESLAEKLSTTIERFEAMRPASSQIPGLPSVAAS